MNKLGLATVPAFLVLIGQFKEATVVAVVKYATKRR